MKKILFTFLLTLLTLCAGAVPAKRGIVRVITLSDGTTVTAQLVGDEFAHYWLAEDGKAYQAIPETDFYRQIDKNQVLKMAEQRRMKANQKRMARMAPRKVGTFGNYTGQKKALIVLVNFSDKTFKSANNQALYQRIANDENFNEGKFKGSMYDYFYAQSQGQFQLTFDVVGPVKVSSTYSYYGKNDRQGNDMHPAEMVIEALGEVLEQYTLDFSKYDWDNDGEVDQVYFVYAGYGEADYDDTNTIWPHAYDLASANYYGDGTGPVSVGNDLVVNTYACGGELNGSTGNIAGIGTMCHEFSHCLGYPDFYDTDYSGGQGMGGWDLMCDGSYNGNGYQPAGYTSYERWVAGWHQPITLSESLTVTNMKSLQEGGESYIIYNDANDNEYFLLENRQKIGWDASLPGEGLLILHVDYDANSWKNNTPNDLPSHQRMTWIPADNEYQYYTYMGTKYYTEEGMVNDPYPYGSVNSFSKNSTPAAKFYNTTSNGTKYMDFDINTITQNSDGTVSFNFVAGENGGDTPQGDTTGKYKLVTSTDELISGKNYLIVSTETDGSNVAYNGLNTDKGLAGVVVPVNGIIDLNSSDNTAVPVVLTEQDDSYWSIQEEDFYLTAASRNKLGTATSYSLGKTSWSISVSDGVATVKNYNNDAYLSYNASADMFRAYTNKQKDIALYKEMESITEVDVTIGIHGALSFSSVYPLDFSQSEVSAYYIIDKQGIKFIRQAVDIVPANTGVILIGQPGDYKVPVAVPTATTPIPEQAEGNLLVATSTGEFTVGEFYGRVYGLFYSNKSQKVGFQKKKADYTFPVNKCYVLLPESYTSAPDSFLEDDSVVSGIVQMASEATGSSDVASGTYNLNGQKVSNDYKGIVIINGKKIIRR